MRSRAPVIRGILICYSHLLSQSLVAGKNRHLYKDVKAIALQTTVKTGLLDGLYISNTCVTEDTRRSRSAVVLFHYRAQEANEIDQISKTVVYANLGDQNSSRIFLKRLVLVRYAVSNFRL